MRRDNYQRLGRQDKFHVKNALKENAFLPNPKRSCLYYPLLSYHAEIQE